MRLIVGPYLVSHFASAASKISPESNFELRGNNIYTNSETIGAVDCQFCDRILVFKTSYSAKFSKLSAIKASDLNSKIIIRFTFLNVQMADKIVH
ncbi:hypothetical protein BpHYR1_004539 [Brachionus plicatilis]|uniref:Uncharacterized protein n=1 Tax=Brachionus plicatilis TaxID=10195 RepID=A0A3M7PY80_BRAPC|nr:hypothetical protein BpHYR1_004539 [Brachionus plicatilis]